jgi:hypothetical protein
VPKANGTLKNPFAQTNAKEYTLSRAFKDDTMIAQHMKGRRAHPLESDQMYKTQGGLKFSKFDQMRQAPE